MTSQIEVPLMKRSYKRRKAKSAVANKLVSYDNSMFDKEKEMELLTH